MFIVVGPMKFDFLFFLFFLNLKEGLSCMFITVGPMKFDFLFGFLFLASVVQMIMCASNM